MSLIEGKGVSIRFGGVKAVENVDFSVEEGEILGLIGPNGAGKSTLLNGISGLCHLSHGTIDYMNRTISVLKPYQIARMGMARTFQIVSPFKHLSVLENAAVGAIFATGKRFSLQQVTESAQEALELTGISAKVNCFPNQLNLSELKKLELARVLAMNPKVLLLDEIMAGLNLSEIEDSIDLISRINRSRNVTIILVEHVMKVIMRLCNRIVVLQFGKKLAENTPEKIASDEKVIQAYLGKKFVDRQRRNSNNMAKMA